MKQWLAAIFLIIYSFQVLPVKSIGKLLCKNQATEETQSTNLTDSDNSEGKAMKYNDFFPSHSFSSPTYASLALSHKIAVCTHHADVFPLHHVAEIPTPPPNRA